MRNMKPYDQKKPFDVYKEAVERKSNGAEKQELQSIEAQMGDCYSDYDMHFTQNDLERMHPAKVGTDHKDALLGLYGSRVKLVKDFRNRFFEINPQTYNNLCPYCAINSSNTTDHILPKDPFPEFAVDVKNLIPVCDECNSAKGDDVLDVYGQKMIINNYTDILPDEQFLHVNISQKGTSLNFDYLLYNPGNRIAPDLYELIERHFDKLHLLKRYKDKAIQEFAEIRNTYLAEQFSDVVAYDVFAAKQIKICDLNVVEYGRNHWKVVLIRACAESQVFKNFICSLKRI